MEDIFSLYSKYSLVFDDPHSEKILTVKRRIRHFAAWGERIVPVLACSHLVPHGLDNCLKTFRPCPI